MTSDLPAILLSCVAVVVLAVLDFHRPYKPSDVRYSVLQERYYFALFLYATLALIAYFLVVALLARLGLAQDASATGALLIVALVPYVPIVARLAAPIRQAMQLIARYPQSVETVSALLALSPLPIDPQAKPELVKDLKVDGVPSDVIKAALAETPTVLSPAAARSLQEVASLRLCFERLKKDRWYGRFCSVRVDILESLETSYLQLIRRAARVILLCEDIELSGHKSSEVMLEASEFIAEEASALRSGYERLLAGAALSFAPGPSARKRLISRFGYHINLPGGLPFTPMAVVFALDFLVSFAPTIVFRIFPEYPAKLQIPVNDVAVWSLAHALAITAAIFWAVYPKAVSNFARPSLFSLPWASYVVFGLASYLTGDAITYIVVRKININSDLLAAKQPLLANSLFALVFLFTTLAISLLLDLRLRSQSYDYRRARVRDGLVLAAVMAGVVLFMMGMLFVLSPQFKAEFELPIKFVALFSVIYAGLGFAMGFIPSTIEAHIEATKLILDAAVTGRGAQEEPSMSTVANAKTS